MVELEILKCFHLNQSWFKTLNLLLWIDNQGMMKILCANIVILLRVWYVHLWCCYWAAMCWFYQKLIPLMPFIVFLRYFYLLLGSKYICIYLFPFPARQSSCDVLLGKFVRKYFLDLCRPRPFFAFNLYYCRNIDSLRKAIKWFQELILNAFILC